MYNSVAQLFGHHAPGPQAAERHAQVIFRERLLGCRASNHLAVADGQQPVEGS